jgi:hypothetical protein
MFSVRGISIIDTYLSGTAESTWKNYKSGWNTFIKFLMEKKYNDTDWEDRKECDKIYLEFLNWAFIGKQIPPSSINIAFVPLFQILILHNQNLSKILREALRQVTLKNLNIQ